MTPALTSHILAVYDAMEKEAVDVEDNKLYIGSLSTLVRSIASTTYYKDIVRSLYDGGYVALIDRGGRSKPSTLLLLRRPQEDELAALTFDPTTPILSLINRMERLERTSGGVNVRMEGIEGKLQKIEERLEQDGKTS